MYHKKIIPLKKKKMKKKLGAFIIKIRASVLILNRNQSKRIAVISKGLKAFTIFFSNIQSGNLMNPRYVLYKFNMNNFFYQMECLQLKTLFK